MKIVYSVEALDDLIRLRKFIADKNPIAATRIGNELVIRIEYLGLFPELGAPVMQAPTPKSIRNIVLGDYIVRYAVHAVAITILRIWHHNEQRE